MSRSIETITNRPASDGGIDRRASFELLRYANCWEDAEVLCGALRPRLGTRVLSIASAGDNSLALLAAGSEVVAADLSAAQLAALDLRVAAFRRLDYERLLAFLGVLPAADRTATYERLEAELSPASRGFWSARRAQVARGIIHAGRLEAYFRKFRTWVLPWIHSRATLRRLLEPKDPGARRRFWDDEWNNRRWRLLFRIFFSRFLMGRLGRDPEFFRYVEGSVSDRILQRTEHALTELATHDNPFLDYIVYGNFSRTLPLYLRRENLDAIRSGLDRLTLVHGPIEEAGRIHARGGFDAFNLSDIFEYLHPETARRLYGDLVDLARPGARLAYWNTLVPRSCPAEFQGRVRSLKALAGELFARDRAFFYCNFEVDEVA
jgi:S-adenosylmethionine-diacylglycerol 3-amino-3-carboxypropyl transferase